MYGRWISTSTFSSINSCLATSSGITTPSSPSRRCTRAFIPIAYTSASVRSRTINTTFTHPFWLLGSGFPHSSFFHIRPFPYAEPAPEPSCQHAAGDQCGDLLPGEEADEQEAREQRSRGSEEVAGGEERGEEEQHGQEAAEDSLENAFDQEGPADDALGGADQTHDVDLFAVEHHLEADDVGDGEGRGDGQDAAGNQTGKIDQTDQPFELPYPVPVVLHLFDAAHHTNGGDLSSKRGRLDGARGDVAFKGRGKGILVELSDDVGEVGEIRPEACQRLLAGNEMTLGEIGVIGQENTDGGDLLRRGVGREVDGHARTPLPALDRALKVFRDEKKGAEDEQRHGDHGHGHEAGPLRLPDTSQGLAKEVAERARGHDVRLALSGDEGAGHRSGPVGEERRAADGRLG